MHTVYAAIIIEDALGENLSHPITKRGPSLLVIQALVYLRKDFHKNLSGYGYISFNQSHKRKENIFIVNLDIRQFSNSVLSVEAH
jgi:hypothetical protein